jgi:hypothetical protein
LSGIIVWATDQGNLFRSQSATRGKLLAVVKFSAVLAILVCLAVWNVSEPLFMLDLWDILYRVVGLATLAFASFCWMLGLTEANEKLRRLAAVSFGVTVACGFFSSPWLIGFAIAAAILPVVLRGLRRIEFADDKLVTNWVGLMACSLLWKVLVGDARLGLTLAIVAVAAMTCGLAVRISELFAFGLNPSAPFIRPNGDWKTKIWMILMRLPHALGVGTPQLLVVAWIALIFNLFFWSKPAFSPVPAVAVIPDTREPESADRIQYVRENPFALPRYDLEDANRDLTNWANLAKAESVERQNELISGQIYARRWIKATALVVLSLLTYLYIRRGKSPSAVMIGSATKEALVLVAVGTRSESGALGSGRSGEMLENQLPTNVKAASSTDS